MYDYYVNVYPTTPETYVVPSTPSLTRTSTKTRATINMYHYRRRGPGKFANTTTSSTTRENRYFHYSRENKYFLYKLCKNTWL